MEILKYIKYQEQIAVLKAQRLQILRNYKFLKKVLFITIVLNICIIGAFVTYARTVNYQLEINSEMNDYEWVAKN